MATMLTVHHLETSRSQRILWLLEELGVPYDLKVYARDPRTRLVLDDFFAVMRREPEGGTRYDAILLDVDNGPSGLTAAANNSLYSMNGLARARAALKPGGILAIWSATPDDAFTRRLDKGTLQ